LEALLASSIKSIKNAIKIQELHTKKDLTQNKFIFYVCTCATEKNFQTPCYKLLGIVYKHGLNTHVLITQTFEL